MEIDTDNWFLSNYNNLMLTQKKPFNWKEGILSKFSDASREIWKSEWEYKIYMIRKRIEKHKSFDTLNPTWNQ